MGKATITGEAGAGLYTVDVVFDTSHAEGRITRLEAIVANVQVAIDAGPGPSELGFLKMRNTALNKEIVRLREAADMSRTVNAWCADRTEGLTGTVGTIEIGTDPDNGVNIHPGDDSGYNATRDGIETPFLTMDVADAMQNFAMMPAIQRHKPTYRYGSISNIDNVNHTCTVTLEACQGTIQGLDLNPATVLSSVPVEYMTCDSAAFADGDSVLVRFDPYDDSGQPKVIGFKREPKPCISALLLIKVGSMYIVWDIAENDIFPISSLSQPAPYSTMNTKLTAMGLTYKKYLSYSSGASGQTTPISPFLAQMSPGIAYGGTCTQYNYTKSSVVYHGYECEHAENLSDDHVLVDDSDVFTSEFQQLRGDYYDAHYSLIWGGPSGVKSGASLNIVKHIHSLGAAYNASLDPAKATKRKTAFFYTGGDFSYSWDVTSGDWGVSEVALFRYDKSYSYKSMLNPSMDATDILTVSKTSTDFNDQVPFLYDYLYDRDVTKVVPIKAAVHDVVSAVLEQPIIASSTDQWGFCKLYAGIDGTPSDPNDLTQPYVYEWADLVEMDVSKIYGYFGTTFNADLAYRKASAGLTVQILSTG